MFFRLPAMLAAAVLLAAAAQPASVPHVPSIDRHGFAALLAGVKGRPAIVNMWATWCEPCRTEFPDLVKFHGEVGERGVEMAVISMDLPDLLESEVIPFLKAQKVSFGAYIKSPGGDEEFINAVDPNWSGALPATFIYDREGKLVRSITGPTTLAQLREIVTPLLPSHR